MVRTSEEILEISGDTSEIIPGGILEGTTKISREIPAIIPAGMTEENAEEKSG